MSTLNKDSINHLDANESAFFKRQLEYVMAEPFNVKYAENKALGIFPIDTSAGYATQVTWRQYDRTGIAKMIADYATDFPRVDIFGKEYSVAPKDIGDSYGYTIQEIRQAQMAGLPLVSERAVTAREVIDNKLNSICLLGDSASNLNGFIQYSGITEATLTSGTAGNTWALKTADEILADMNGLVNAVVEGTNGVEIPDTMLLPHANWEIIRTKRLGTVSDTTVLEYFMRTNGYIKSVLWLRELATGSDTGGTRAMVFKNDRRHLFFILPVPFEQFEAEKQGLAYTIPCLARTGGMVIPYPASVAFMDGV